MRSMLPEIPAPLSRMLGLFSLLLISAALLTSLQAQQALTAAYHVMSKNADGSVTCRMMSPTAAADLGLVLDHQTSSLQPQESSPQQGGASITVNYSGFTAEAQAAFQFAVDIWEALLDTNIQIIVDATFSPLPEGQLGTGGGSFTSSVPNGLPGFAYILSLADQLADSNLFPGTSHIMANFSSSEPDWYFGTDANLASGQVDFVSVVLHELGHGLGFNGSFEVNGMEGSFGIDFGSNFGGITPTIYDNFVENSGGASLIDTGIFGNPSSELGMALTSGDLFFDGPLARVGNGGSAPDLFAPDPFDNGSSISHLDEATYPMGNANALMTPTIISGEANHAPGPVTLGLFQDMGWLVSQMLEITHLPLAAAAGLHLVYRVPAIAAIGRRRGHVG